MKLSSLLGHTSELLQAVQSSTRPADTQIDTYFRSRKYLGSHDRRFIAETTYGVLRHLRRSEAILLRALGEEAGNMMPEDGFLLLIIAYLVKQGNQTALVAGDVAPMIKSGHLRMRVPAILEAIATAKEPEIADFVERVGTHHSFPEWMVRRFVSEYGEEETERICESLNIQAPVTLRVNTLKSTVEECQIRLKEEGIETSRTPLSPFGLRLERRTNVFQLQAFRDGFFEVQDEGSQLLPLLIDPKPNARVLDACAGAGGKTLELSALMKNRGEIVAADVHSSRLEELRKRSRRAGVSNVRVHQVMDIAELGDQFAGYFDVVLVDAPCSGIGTLRRNPGMKWMVSEETVAEVSQKQAHILAESARFLKPGGVLTYATCTMFRAENEDVVEAFLRTHPEFSTTEPPLDPARFDASPFKIGPFIRFLPHRDGTDGFFVAVLKKQAVPG